MAVTRQGPDGVTHREPRPAHPIGAAFFDLDKTVIARAALVAFSPVLLKEGMLSRWLVARALWGQLVFRYMGADEERMAKMREAALRVTKGWDHERVRRIVRDTLVDVIDPIVYSEALELIAHHRDLGRRVYLVSASPEEIVRPLAGYLGVHEAVATRAELDDKGRYTGEVEFYCQGPNKAVAMAAFAERDGIDLGASYAYSDSITDLPMLEAVGTPVVVNPDRELARVAAEREWEIRRFSHGVSLRERFANTTTTQRAAGGSALVAAGAAVAAGVALSRRARRPPRGLARLTGQLRR